MGGCVGEVGEGGCDAGEEVGEVVRMRECYGKAEVLDGRAVWDKKSNVSGAEENCGADAGMEKKKMRWGCWCGPGVFGG